MLPYRLAILLLLCVSIGSSVGQEEQEVEVETEVATSDPQEEEEERTVELGNHTSFSAPDDEAMLAMTPEEEEKAEEEIEYEWRPFLQEFPNATCPNLQGVERWTVLTHYQCPGKRSWYSCIDDLLELPQYRRYKCRPILFRWERHAVNRTAGEKGRDRENEIAIRPEEVHMAGPNFIAALKERGRHGSNFCMLMLFYSPTCPFSARWAPYFNALPPRYTNILFVAVNASDPANGRMNSRLGIAGTPTMILYVDGSPVARVDEQLDPAEHLPHFIEGFTDWHTDGELKPDPEGNVQVEPAADRSHQWIAISFAVYCVSFLYHFAAYTETGKRKWAELLLRIRG